MTSAGALCPEDCKCVNLSIMLSAIHPPLLHTTEDTHGGWGVTRLQSLASGYHYYLWRVLCVLWTNGTHHVCPLDIHLCFGLCAYAHISAYDELKKRILHAVYADIYICRKPHMGQFVQGGKNGRLMSVFFLSRASV